MAVFNEILAGRFNRAVQKLFGMKGPPPTPQLASEIIPIYPFASGVENRYLEGWNRFTFGLTIAAVAANQSGFRLRNPSGSGALIVIEKLSFTPRTASDSFTLTNGPATADLATIVGLSNARMDSRGSPQPTGVLSQQNNAVSIPALANTAARPASLQNTEIQMIWFEDHEITLLPGDAYEVTEDTVNVALLGTVIWRERVLEDSEKF